MNSYKSFVRKNRQVVIAAEGLASTATWLLPERLASSEMAPELISTAVGLLSVFNQHIVDTAPQEPKPEELHPGAFAKVRGEEPPSRQKEGGGLPWALLLAVTKEMEVLTEMAAQSMLGDDNKWGPVATIEAVKVLFRLLIFQKSGYEMIIDGGQTTNERVPDVPAVTKSPPPGRSSVLLEEIDPMCRSGASTTQQAMQNSYGERNGFHNGVYYPEAYRQGAHSGFEPQRQENNNPFLSSPQDLFPVGKGGRAMAAFSRFQSRVGGPSSLPNPVPWAFPPRPRGEGMERDTNDFLPSPDSRRSFPCPRDGFTAPMNGDAGHAYAPSNGFYPHVNGNGYPDSEPTPCPPWRNGFSNQTPAQNEYSGRPSKTWISPPSSAYPAIDVSHCHPTEPSAPCSSSDPYASKVVSIPRSIGSPLKELSSTHWAKGVRFTAEVLHIMRPLVYVLMLRKYGRKAWLPWLASLGMDIGSLGLLAKNEELGRFLRRLQTGEVQEGEDGEARAELPAEQDEVKRRQMLLALYLMRSPCFELVVQNRLEGVQSLLRPIPVVGTLAEKAVDLLKGIQGYHFYTAAS